MLFFLCYTFKNMNQLLVKASAVILPAALFVSCYHALDTAETVPSTEQQVVFRFKPFEMSQQPFDEATRAIFATPIVLLVIDEMGGEVKQVKQLSTSAGGNGVTQVSDVLADLSMNLSIGTHNVYFVAAGRPYHSYDADALTVTWDVATANLNYTWAKKVEVNVSGSASVTQSVTLPLVVGRVDLVCNDRQDPLIRQMVVEGENICWTLDLETMKGRSSEDGITIVFPYNLDSYDAGKTFAFCSFEPMAEEGATPSVGQVTFTAKKADDSVIASHTLSNVPVRAGYLTQFTGSFYSAAVGFSLSIADDWTGIISDTAW